MKNRPSPSGRKQDSDRHYKSDREDRGKSDEKKPYGKREDNAGGYRKSADGNSGEKRPFTKREDNGGGYKRPGTDRDRGPREGFSGDRRPDGERKPFKRSEDDRGGFKKEGFKGGDRDRGPREGFSGDRKQDGEKRPYAKREDKPGGYKKPSEGFRGGDRERAPREGTGSDRRQDGERKPYQKRDDSAGDYKKSSDGFKGGDRDRQSRDGAGGDRPRGKFDKPGFSKDRDTDRPKRSFDKKEGNGGFAERMDKAFIDPDKAQKRKEREEESAKALSGLKDKKFTIDKEITKEEDFDNAYPLGTRKVSGPFRKKFETEKKKTFDPKERARVPKKVVHAKDENGELKEWTLNKYISHSGECSRRDAADLVKKGKVKVNGELMLDPGYRVLEFDEVTIAGKKLTPQRDRVYLLLNKPKGYITTTEDPEGRKTVMDLIAAGDFGRLFPVGRLDRNTTGLLLMTNDGELAQKLSHPSYSIKKVYQVTLDKNLTKADFDKIVNGITLEDGEIAIDAMSYLDNKNEVGLEIHSGRNRIVRRIFESLGYEVEKLDRVMYAGLTKKNLPRSEWRILNEKEVILLKHFKA